MNTNPADLVSSAEKAQKAGDWQKASQLWTTVMEQSPQNMDACLKKGNCLIKLEQYDDAESVFSESIVSWPEHPAGYLGLATSYLKQNKLPQALDILYKTKEKHPQNVNVRLLLCQLFMRLKQYDIARSFVSNLECSVNENPHVSKVLNRLSADSNKIYDQDGLLSVHNHDFINDEEFIAAYQRGVNAADGKDYHWHWRVHIGLWAASVANAINGDFIECGVNKGFLSSAILTYLNWNESTRKIFLLDTFGGIDSDYVSEEEIKSGILQKNELKLESGSYTNSFLEVQKNFSEWNNVYLIQGAIPDTLSQVETDQVAFLHLDMNSTIPEQAALEYFWPKLSKGAVVLMDDYAYKGFIEQKKGMDKIAKNKNHKIVSLPTGQGLLIKA